MKDVSSYFVQDEDFVQHEVEDTYKGHDVHCPVLLRKAEDADSVVLNWHSDWCLNRIRWNKPCTKKCKVVQEIIEMWLKLEEK